MWPRLYGVTGGVQEEEKDEAGEEGASRAGGLPGSEDSKGVTTVGDEIDEVSATASDTVDGVSERGEVAVPLTLGDVVLSLAVLPMRGRRDCSWSNSKSSRRCVSASFC